MKQEIQKKGEVILYHPTETIKLEVRLENETVWLTQQQIAELFGVRQPAISKHLNNIFKEEELDPSSVHSILEYTASDGKIYKTNFYNLDAILSVGYRVNSKNATQFRRWANSILKEYLLKGYSVNTQLLQMEQRFEAKFLSQHDEILQIKQIQRHQQEQIDLYIKTNEEPKEMLFGNGCVFDAWNYISDLVRSAKREIVLIDNYVDDTVLAILSKREKGVKATVHSRYRAKLIADLEKYNKQFPDAEIDFIQFSDKNHDRFLIIDDDVYMLGNSVKDFGNAWGAVIRMEMSKGDILAMVERR